ncbi:MAG: indolepyruvate oxidoreductase subunit beta [Candidatus Hydrogenedentes bacterium]|nr:indolepyruvate oxidoreductase subunit beta [Candidatus Hydrogenedentota bacterium]
MTDSVTNIVIAGLGGQGVVKASEILAGAAFRAGFDVKKSEVHGMSQRGGSVTSDVRYGAEVFSPMVPPAEADYLLVLEESEAAVNRPRLRPGGVLLAASELYDDDRLERIRANRTLNVAMLGALSAHLEIPEEDWLDAIRANLPEKAQDANIHVFERGRAAEKLMGYVTRLIGAD